MKIARIMKKILVVLMLFVFLSVNFTSSFAANEFYYSGTQKGTYQAKASFFSAITKMLADLADYLIGLATLGHRMFLVGWTSIAELILNDTLEAAAGDSQPFEISAATLDMTDANDQRKVTVENIVFNKIPLLDINFFNTEIDDTVTGTGAVKTRLEEENKNGRVEATNDGTKVSGTGINIEEDEELPEGAVDPATADESVITIIKNAIAKWYYAMRSVAIGAMLIILLYIALRLIVATVGEQKAKYKQMLYNWVVGFAVVFCIHYVMLFVIMINEELVAIFNQMSVEYVEKDYKSAADKTNTEMELSLYSSLRSRAYELKASRGWIGTILYMVLVYYAVRYTLVYLKRYFTVMILAMLAPIMSATYAFGKVRTGKAESFNKWVKEFVFAVLLQSVHAMTYVTLITQLLKLTESSLAGVVLSFLILNFMLKTDGIVKRIFNMSTGQHGALDNILGAPGAVASAFTGLQAGGQIAAMYGKYWLKPVYGGMAKVVGAGLSIPGNALLGGAGGALAHYADNRAMNQAVARDAARGKDGAQGNGTGAESGSGEAGEGMRRGPGGVLLDSEGKPIKNEAGKYGNSNRGSAWSGNSINGAFNPTYFADKSQAKIDKKKADAEKKGKTYTEPKWRKRGAMMADTVKAHALDSVQRSLYRKGYWDQPKMLTGIDAQIEKKLETIRKNKKKANQEQIGKLTTMLGGIVIRTTAIPLLIANPKAGITMFAQGHKMIQKVGGYDKKGKIRTKSIRGYKEVIDKETGKPKIDEKTGKPMMEMKVRPVLFTTSAGTFVKKATGIAFFEGLSTNINDDIDKVMKQNKKDLKELEMLYDAREQLYELEILKQERIMEHEMFLADPQQAHRRIKLQKDIQDGDLSVYEGRVMETNPVLKKFMEENKIETPEQIVAMNALLKTALDTKQGDIRDMNIEKTGMYAQVMEKVNEEMLVMGLNKVEVSDEERAKMNELGLTNQDIKDTRLDDIDAAMTAIKEVLDSDPTQAATLLRAMAVQEATAEALNKKEEEITEKFEEAGIISFVTDNREEINKREADVAKRKEYVETSLDAGVPKEDLIEEINAIAIEEGKIESAKYENQQQLEEKVVEVLAQEGVINKEEYIEKKTEYEELSREIETLKFELQELENDPAQIERVEEIREELAEREPVLTEKENEFKEVREIVADAMNDAESISVGGKTKIEIQEVTTEEIMEALVETGSYEAVLEMERKEKPTECQKIENVLMSLEDGGVIEVPLQQEDLEARKEAIKDLVEEIKVEKLGESVTEEFTGKYDEEGKKVREWETVEQEKVERQEKTLDEILEDKKSKSEKFAEILSEERKEEELKDPIEEIAKEIEETIEKTVSKSSVANELFDETEQGKDLKDMSDDLLREIYRDTTTESNETLEYVNPKKQEEVTVKELDAARRRIKEKLDSSEVSDKDKSQLKEFLKEFEKGEPMSVEDFNNIVRRVNGVNAVAEEAFIKEMREENSASNVPHNDDHVTTTADRVRRSMNSDRVRESISTQSEIQTKVAEILRNNDYAAFEVVTSKSSGYAGKKYEKGPLINLSDVIKNLD